MAFTTTIRFSLNRYLRPLNLRLETLTAEKSERSRLAVLDEAAHFSQPAFALPPAFKSMAANQLLEELHSYPARFDDFENPARNDVGYTFNNDYFTTPDAEVLYAIIRRYGPGMFIEVGSGNSTRIARQAIIDGGLKTRLISIDPNPRLNVGDLADEVYPKAVETLGNTEIFSSLKAGDILFIDSSHEIKTGNDVVFLYLNVMPALCPGVLIHIHDIFLPYEYPREWVMEKQWGFNEQYLAQSLLTFGEIFEVLWAGYYIQRTRPDFEQYFPRLRGRRAQSLWLRKTK